MPSLSHVLVCAAVGCVVLVGWVGGCSMPEDGESVGQARLAISNVTSFNWRQQLFSGIPAGFVKKGIEDPCSKPSDCQFDFYCKDPGPHGICMQYGGGQSNALCHGIDLTAGVPCSDGTVPICNRGDADVAAGTILGLFQKNGGGDKFGNGCIGEAESCAFTLGTALLAGTCLNIPIPVGCHANGNSTLFVNPPVAAGVPPRVAECADLGGGQSGCANNWTDVKQAGVCAPLSAGPTEKPDGPPDPAPEPVADAASDAGSDGQPVDGDAASDTGPDPAPPCHASRVAASMSVVGGNGHPLEGIDENTVISVETRAAGGAWQPASNVTLDVHASPPLDVMIVADNSGSEARRIKNEIDAITQFAQRILHRGRGDRVGLVRVSTQSRLFVAPTDDENALQAAIAQLHVDKGWTSLWDGVRLANRSLAESVLPVSAGPTSAALCYAGRYRSIVVFTDGQDNASSGEHASATTPDDGVNTTLADLFKLTVDDVATPIYTVGVGRAINVGDLELLASNTGGQFARIADWDALVGAMVATASKLDRLIPICFDPAQCDASEVRATFGATSYVFPMPGGS